MRLLLDFKMMERTLILLKPDCVQRCFTGRVIQRFEDAGFTIVGMKMVWADESLAGEHYREDIAEKYGEDVRNGLISYVTNGPVLAIVLEGVNAIENVRKIVGSTYPSESLPGTIRGDFAHISKDYANENKRDVRNLIHASGNASDAKKELKLWFKDKELHSYTTVHDLHVY